MDVILDSVGAPYFKRNLESLNYDGRLFVIGTIGGRVTELDLRALFPKRLTVQGTNIFEIWYHMLSFMDLVSLSKIISSCLFFFISNVTVPEPQDIHFSK